MEIVKTDLTFYSFIGANPKFTGCIINADGSKFWCLDGKLHRTDGPAVERADGSKFWYLNGELHRTDGPAVIKADGDRFWYLNGEGLSEGEWKSSVSSTCNETK